jgi:hypothetical protein
VPSNVVNLLVTEQHQSHAVIRHVNSFNPPQAFDQIHLDGSGIYQAVKSVGVVLGEMMCKTSLVIPGLSARHGDKTGAC